MSQQSNSNWKVTKSNNLIQAGYALTLNEQRLILFCIAQIDSRKPLERIRDIRASDFAHAYEIDTRHAYEALEDATDRLWNREVKTRFDDGRLEKIRWVSKATYHAGTGKVTINFSPEILPLLTLLTKRFTTYELRYVAKLSSTYSIRFYEYLKQYANMQQTKLETDLSDLREMLELGSTYSRFSNMKARVIQPAIDQINQFTDLHVSWEPIREKRAVVALRFQINLPEQPELPLA